MISSHINELWTVIWAAVCSLVASIARTLLIEHVQASTNLSNQFVLAKHASAPYFFDALLFPCGPRGPGHLVAAQSCIPSRTWTSTLRVQQASLLIQEKDITPALCIMVLRHQGRVATKLWAPRYPPFLSVMMSIPALQI